MLKVGTAAVVTFFIALGVILGGVFVGSLGAFLFNEPPLNSMLELVKKLKIWALVTALGGTFPTIEVMETGFLGGQPSTVLKQTILVLSAFFGAHLGYIIIIFLVGGK